MAAGRFIALDGLRGVAALVVLVLHAQMLTGGDTAPHGAIAVDVFFVLSGFVVSHAYDGRLSRGWGVIGFIKARLKRLYPLYFAGLMLGAAVALFLGNPLGLVALLAANGIVMVPIASVGPEAKIFPLNPPTWSLLCEFAVNALYAVLAPRLSNRMLGLVVAAGAAWVAFSAFKEGGLDGGYNTVTILTGFGRALFGFFLGVGFYRLHRAGKLQKLARVPAFLLLAVFVALSLILIVRGLAGAAIDLLLVLAVIPALVAATSQAVVARPWERRVYGALARLSYPLYVTHFPVLVLLQYKLITPSKPLLLFAFLALSLAVAYAAERWFDRPLQELRLRSLPAT